MSVDYSAIKDHKTWLGYIQPDGLVVSPAALVDAQVILNHNVAPLQGRFNALIEEIKINDDNDTTYAIPDFANVAREFLEWPDELIFGYDDSQPIPDSLCVQLSNYGETLKPNLALRDHDPKTPFPPWLLLVKTLPTGTDMDKHSSTEDSDWSASPARKFERLLRETNAPIGLLFNGLSFRLFYAPRGENTGSATFNVSDMRETAGRPILAAFHMLLHQNRLLTGSRDSRLPALLVKSRQYQSRVSATLAQQVLDALYELLRGFTSANDKVQGKLLHDYIENRPDDIYGGLLTILMRLVFLLFAEDRGLMPVSELYDRYYSIRGLFKRLREDKEQYADTMDNRFGAWAQLITLFHAVHNGCKHPEMKLPPRYGHLFNPERYPFIGIKNAEQQSVPLVSDGTVFRILEKLLLLDGERLSYRTLDVEEIGSVYQTVMGFTVEKVSTPAIAIKGKSKKGSVPAATVINLDELLKAKPSNRKKFLKEKTDQEVTSTAEQSLKSATTIDELLAALEKKIDTSATPQLIPEGGVVLQPTDERRRSGSHYTPRSFTEPIVRTTLRPVIEQLGEHPTPEQILDLKVCDPAVGSAAFLVEACRQLGDELVKAWHYHNDRPHIPDDETEELHAQRLIAQRCLYGVDRNQMAVNLAKLSIWLATLAKDHPFTFLDHNVRCGDSLVGFTRKQIEYFHWRPTETEGILEMNLDYIENRIKGVTQLRKDILDAGDDESPELKRQQLDKADEALMPIREVADLLLTAFFSASKDTARHSLRNQLLQTANDYLENKINTIDKELELLCNGEHPVTPFHWEIEFPEVFDGENPGFDAIIGNPPFAGKNTTIDGNRAGYLDWLKSLHPQSHGNADLSAHFYRRAFNLLRDNGCFGLIATNTIGQGDTRSTGLRWICTNGGTIYAARKRAKWPGQAAVVVSIVNVTKGKLPPPYNLDGREVPIITAYLFHDGGHDDPATLKANEDKSFIGSYVLGMGFTFDDTSTDGVANPISEMNRLIAKDPRNAERIFPYIGGDEVNHSPTHEHHRYVINFEDFPLKRDHIGIKWATADFEKRKSLRRKPVVPFDYPYPVAEDWPDLLIIVERKVKPDREKLGDNADAQRRKQKWWLWGRYTPALFTALIDKQEVLVQSEVSTFIEMAFVPANQIFAHTLNIFTLERYFSFCILQSRIHDAWVRFLGSSLGDGLRYTPTDCFETFPFPPLESSETLEQTGREYYEFRAELMVRNNEGLTKTYNRFHDPNETSDDIKKLRELHSAMDRAVLEAYRWKDLAANAKCEFILDYEVEDDDENGSRRRKKPWRYRWLDEFRDEVLATLLKLNKERAEEEAKEEKDMIKGGMNPAPKRKGGRKKSISPDQHGLGFE